MWQTAKICTARPSFEGGDDDSHPKATPNCGSAFSWVVKLLPGFQAPFSSQYGETMNGHRGADLWVVHGLTRAAGKRGSVGEVPHLWAGFKACIMVMQRNKTLVLLLTDVLFLAADMAVEEPGGIARSAPAPAQVPSRKRTTRQSVYRGSGRPESRPRLRQKRQ